MRLTLIYDLINEAAPFALSNEYCAKYDAYDNSGILVDQGEEITGVLFSLDLSMRAVEEAKKMGANLIVTHHPAIYAPVKSVKVDSSTQALLAAIRAGISVISAHLNLDCANDGIDENLMRALGGKTAKEMMHVLSTGGYGKRFSVEAQSVETFSQNAERELNSRRIVCYGDKPVKEVASFCGAGLDDETVKFAIASGADTVVSSDGKHHLIAELLERGMNVLLITHYSAEAYGFARFYEKIKEKTPVRCSLFTDDRLL